jgi:hypothetical protein
MIFRRGGTIKCFLILILFLPSLLSFARAAEKDKPFAGTVTVTETRRGVAMQFVFTRQDKYLRIEKADHSKPEPVNIVDLAARKLTLVYPRGEGDV